MAWYSAFPFLEVWREEVCIAAFDVKHVSH
jgi:hypothetical protein